MRERFIFYCSKCGKGKCQCVERSYAVRCVKCGNSLDSCSCTCPYCGERDGCDCVTGYGRATGG